MEPIARMVMFALIMIGAVILAIAIRGDPARGRRRCPKCWYDMQSAAPAGPCRCPECGRDIRCDRDLLRTRRHPRWVAVGASLLFAGAAVYPAVMFAVMGWRFIPAPVVILAGRYMPLNPGPGATGRELGSAMGVAATRPLPGWQQAMLRQTLERRMDSRDPEVRALSIRIADAAAQAGNDMRALVPRITGALADADPKVQERAAIAMLSMRPGDPSLLPHWEMLLAGLPNYFAKSAAISSMGQMLDAGSSAPIPLLLRLLESETGQAREQIAYQLGFSTDAEVARRLATELSSGSPTMTLLSLSRMEEAAAPAVTAMIDLFDTAPESHYLLLKTLGRLRTGAHSAMPTLEQHLSNRVLGNRREAVRSVGLIGDPPEHVRQRIIQMLRDSEQGVNHLISDAVLETLFRTGWEPDGPALLRIRELAASGPPLAQVWARLYIARLEGREDAHALELAREIENPDALVAIAAIQGLEALGPKAHPAIPALEALTAQDPWDRRPGTPHEEARNALRRIRPNAAHPPRR